MDTAPLASTQAQNCRYRPDGDCRFAGVCPRDATRVCKEKGTSIALPGVKPSRVYLVHEGVVGLFRAWPSGEETIISLSTPGSMFGALSLLEEGDPSKPGQFLGHLRTLTATCLCEVSPESFLSNSCGNPSVARVVVSLLVKEIRQAYRISMLPARHGPERALAHVLALLAEKDSERCAEGWLISSCFIHQDLAEMARLTRATATRALHTLHRHHLIDFRGRQILVLSIDRLWAMVEDVPNC